MTETLSGKPGKYGVEIGSDDCLFGRQALDTRLLSCVSELLGLLLEDFSRLGQFAPLQAEFLSPQEVGQGEHQKRGGPKAPA